MAERELALVLAARQIDLQPFRGRIADPEQALAWPRARAVDAEGRVLDPEAVPDAVKLAQAELALHLLEEDFEHGGGAPASVRRARAGPVELEFTAPPRAEALPDRVLAVLRPLLEGQHSLRLLP